MNKSIAARTTVLGGALLGASLLASVPAAQAEPAPAPAGKVEFAYSAPEVARAGDSVTWNWTLRNLGAQNVDNVVLTHRITPQLKVAKVSPQCKVLASTVRCAYGRLAAGATTRGALTAAVPSNTRGSIQINGRVTWQERQVPAGTSAPGEQAAPGQQAAPNGQAAPEQQVAPDAQTAPDAKAAPNQQAAPEQQAAPNQQAAPDQQAAPEQQAAPNQQAAPEAPKAPAAPKSQAASSGKAATSGRTHQAAPAMIPPQG
ncbi:hypothetical protein [Actinomadura rupiterrae]|uniref:hypothetical protein n=1 Tax=Actinomadura rupiterrae TaxID=559627 RepID=UPI0020A4879F|nr:hypothetical protein [Actinomadura rupiterrae]MCP2341896.1 putative repeat protein (TIGR01451 family) [Actinomadura rupiterrae]